MLSVNGMIGDWVCQGLLGRGAHGEVTLWKNQRTEASMAVKSFLLHTEGQHMEYHENKFLEEADLMDKIKHPHIVSTVEPPPEFSTSLASTAVQYIASFWRPSPVMHLLYMEFCDGGTLRSLLRQPENVNGLSEKEIRAVLEDISNAISHLHGIQIIHRDIKPENILIMLNPVTDRNVYKLGDLGLAKDMSEGSLGKTIVGTMAYLAPEIQALYYADTSVSEIGSGDMDPKRYGKSADYWSFGVIAFEICCGTLPFLPELPSKQAFARYATVKNKSDEVIAITKGEDCYIFHKKLPYETRLPPLLEGCISAWLPSMLRWKHHSRGQYPVRTDRDALLRLNRILQASFLEIYSVFNHLHYIINDHKKIINVQELIMDDTHIPVEQQIIFTRDGIQLEPNDNALDFHKMCPLYLLDKSKSEIACSATKLSPPLATFIRDTSGTGKFPEHQVWKVAIHDTQEKLEKSERLANYIEALRKFAIRVMQSPSTNLFNRLFHLNKLLEQEEKLDVSHLLSEEAVPLENIVQSRDAVKRDICQHPPNCEIILTLQHENLPVLREMCEVLPKLYHEWRDAGKNNEKYNMSILASIIREICLAEESGLRTRITNYATLFQHLFPQADNFELQKQQSQLQELERLIKLLESRQLLKDKKLLELCNFK